MPNNFEEASAATENMFANEQTEPTTVENAGEANASPEHTQENTENQEVSNASGQATDSGDESAMLDEATQTAETAANIASEKNAELQQVMQEMEAIKRQNQQLQGTIEELSRRNEDKVISEALAPPTLDISSLAFADEATQKSAMEKFAEDLSAYNRNQVIKEISPALEYAKRGLAEAEKSEAIEALSQIPDLSGIKEMIPQLDRIISNNKWLQSDDMPVEEKYINAYVMANGINRINTPEEPVKEPTTEELMNIYNNNKEFQDMVEKQRLEKVKNSQQVPPFSASSGAVNAALDIKEKPKTLEEASERTRAMFGSM